MTEQHPGDPTHVGPAGPTDDQLDAGRPQEPAQPFSEPASATVAPRPAVAPPEVAHEPETEWNPLASTDVVELSVPSSGGRAKILVKPWSGRERLTYEDQLLSRFMVPGRPDDGQEPDEVPDVVKLATMRLVGASLTLQGSIGFPERTDGTAMFSGGDKRRVEAELLALSTPVYEEVRGLCLRFQPLPTAQVDDDRPGDGKEAGDADPFPTPSTPATAAP